MAGLVGAGVGAGVSSLLAGGSFSAGALGTTSAKVATACFWDGAAIGASGGLAGGFIGGLGNGVSNGESFSNALNDGIKSGIAGALCGGIISGLSSGIQAVSEGKTFWRGGVIEREGLAYDWDYDRTTILGKQQNGKYGCADKALDNVSASEDITNIKGSDVRSDLSTIKSSKFKVTLDPNETGLPDVSAVDDYANRVGAKVYPCSNPSTSLVSGEDDIIRRGGKVLISYPNGEMNHMVNVQGAFRQTITYSNGTSSIPKIYMIVLSNGTKTIMPASSLSGKGVNIFNLFFK